MPDLSKQLKRITALFLSFLLLLAATVTAALPVSAQEQSQMPQATARVNDFALTLEAGVKERLEIILANLKERGKIEFKIAVLKTTQGEDIFDYSLKLARAWDTGALTSKEASLLLVVSADDGKFFTQVSRRFRSDLPDGLLGEMGNRMREPLGKGNYGEALMNAVQTFITQLSERRGFSLEGIDQVQTTAATKAAATETTAANNTATPAPTPEEMTAKTPAESEPAATTKAPAKEPAAKQSSLRETSAKTSKPAARDSGSEKAELEALVELPPAERIEKLRAFIEARPRSSLKTYAAELIVSARASLGDEKLKAGDAKGGIEQFRLAIEQSPEKMSDALFLRVVSQLPANLFLRGERAAAREAARQIEAKVKDDPKRLLALAGFYLSVEDADEAARLSELALQLAPEMAGAHQMLGASRHVGLRLDEAVTEYARALELDPKLAAARRSLADLRRATGKTEDALTLYREQLQIDPADRLARAGMVLALLDLGKKEEAEREFETALKDDPQNMALMVGASYWYMTKGEAARAQELATKAIEIEPRYIWAHIALARALIAQKRPLDAERALRYARQYGGFRTLDYELASALAASGLYEEAAAELMRSFTIKDGQLQTRLAGRVPAHAENFIELLTPERRAGIFQATVADTESNARMLKGLLGLAIVLGGENRGSVDRALLSSALGDFLAGEDAMHTFRRLHAASRLLRRNVELNRVVELAEAATLGVDAALDTPSATVAVMADELRDARARAIGSGSVLTVAEIPRNLLSNILRGRIEDLKGWALFNQDKAAEAVSHLRRALSVLPENTVWWRTAQWHMGASLDATGNQREALNAYLKSYNPAAPNPVQRAIIEALYRKVNGSLDGLDEKIGRAPSVTSNAPGTPPE
jgi:tetratricopeptide (TPR) repeat protein